MGWINSLVLRHDLPSLRDPVHGVFLDGADRTCEGALLGHTVDPSLRESSITLLVSPGGGADFDVVEAIAVVEHLLVTILLE